MEPETLFLQPPDILYGRHSDVRRARLQHRRALLRLIRLHEHQIVKRRVGAPVIHPRLRLYPLRRQPLMHHKRPRPVRHAKRIAQLVKQRLGLHPYRVLADRRRVLQPVRAKRPVLGYRNILALRAPRLVVLIRLRRVGMRRVRILRTRVVERPRHILRGKRPNPDKLAALRAIEVNPLADEHPYLALIGGIGQIRLIQPVKPFAVHSDCAARFGGKFPLPALRHERRVAGLARIPNRIAIAVKSGLPPQQRLLESKEPMEQHIRPRPFDIAELRRPHIVKRHRNRNALRRLRHSRRRSRRGRCGRCRLP